MHRCYIRQADALLALVVRSKFLPSKLLRNKLLLCRCYCCYVPYLRSECFHLSSFCLRNAAYLPYLPCESSTKGLQQYLLTGTWYQATKKTRHYKIPTPNGVGVQR